MFQFGLFASHLPHLIIAAAYMIYFGACAFQGSEESEMEQDSSENYIVQSYEKTESVSTISFYDVFVSQFTDEANICKIDQYTAKVKEIFHVFEEPLYDRYPGSNVLSRPPPFC